MLTVLFLASYASGEWVEIAQNHYRKEPSRRVTLHYEDTAVANRVYTNYSVTERPWHQGAVATVPNRGNIRRVQFPSNAKDTFSSGRLSERISLTETTNTNREYENFGPVRAPNVKSADRFETKVVKKKFNDADKFNGESVKINEKSNIRLHVPPQRISLTTPNIEKQVKENDHKRFQEIKMLNEGNHEKFLLNTFEENFNNEPEQSSDDSKNKRVRIIKHSNEDLNKGSGDKVRNFNMNYEKIENSLKDKSKNGTSSHIRSSLPKEQLPSQKTVTTTKPTHRTDVDINGNVINESHSIKEPYKEIKVENLSEIIKELNSPSGNQDGKGPNHDGQDASDGEKNLDQNSKSNTVEIIWNLMRVVTDNISRNTRRSFRSKVRYLEGLRNTILSNIDERIEEVWPDEARGGARLRRSAAARGHVEFPSSESALMTISFLTFAVFLIKLVLQVIHTYKNKTMMVTPAVVAAVGRAAATLSQQSPNN